MADTTTRSWTAAVIAVEINGKRFGAVTLAYDDICCDRPEEAAVRRVETYYRPYEMADLRFIVEVIGRDGKKLHYFVMADAPTYTAKMIHGE